MTENPYTPPEAALYGGGAPAAKPKGPGLMEQIEGLFTSPRALFEKLHDAPSWVPALVVTLVLVLIVTTVWVAKVDADAFFRPILERNPKVSADQVDSIIEIQKKFLPLGAIFAPIVAAAGIFFFALIYWGLGAAFSQEPVKPTYTQGLVAATVPGLVLIPHGLLMIVMALAKGVGGLSPEKLPPTSLGFFLQPEGPRVAALLYQLDAFMIASWVMLYFAFRHTLRLLPARAGLATGLVVLLTLGLKVLFAK
ncbi:MAG TPA: YIP1 family protein [Holophagaceae bacterium]|nr:YIP1 family protein [Holophagaceae bacterium]